MRDGNKNKLGIFAAIVLLSILSILLISNLSAFALPSSSNLSGIIPHPKQSKGSDGLLLITAYANLTLYPSGKGQSPGLGAIKVASDMPLAGVDVVVTSTESSANSVTNLTNNLGQVADYLAPGSYKVLFLDWRFNDSSVTIDVTSGQVTSLKSIVSVSDFQVESFQINDPHSSGTALTWEPLYVQIPTTNTVSSSKSSVYFEINNVSSSTAISTSGASGLVRVTVLGNLSEQGSEWLKVSAESPFTIQSIRSVQVMTLNATYLVTT
jgi:hypothetical protein